MSRATGRLAALMAATLLAGCTPAGNGHTDEIAPDTLVYTGVVAQSGSSVTPMVVLEQDGADAVRLGGALLPELERIAGGTVRVSGHWTAVNGGSLDVVDYEILNIAGGVPVVGVLEDRAGELWLRGAQSVRLLDPPTELRDRIGARAWIVGESDGGGLRLQSYGIIAEP